MHLVPDSHSQDVSYAWLMACILMIYMYIRFRFVTPGGLKFAYDIQGHHTFLSFLPEVIFVALEYCRRLRARVCVPLCPSIMSLCTQSICIYLFTTKYRYFLWIAVVPLFTILSHLGTRMRVSGLHSRAVGHPICDPGRIIATRQLDALTVLWTHYVSYTCIYFQSHLLCW